MSSRISLALSLTLLLVALGWTAPSAARQPDESIPSTFQILICPEDYAGDAYLKDCSPADAGDWSITVTDTHPTEPTATTATDGNGVVTFATLPGPTRFDLDVPAGTTLYYACFDGAGTFTRDGSERTIEVSLAEGDALSCRWYITPTSGTDEPTTEPVPRSEDDPADGSVGIQVFDCPEGYDGDDYAEACEPTERPVGVTLNDGYEFDEATLIRDQAGDDGRAGFVDLFGGQYYLTVEDLSETSTIYWDCFTLDGDAEQFDQDGLHNRVRFFLDTSADYSCRIYLTANGPATPEPGTPGTVTVFVLSCPEGYRGPDWAVRCTREVDSNHVGASGSPIDPETDSLEIYEGVATFRDVEPGRIRPGTDIPGHATEQRSACVIGPGPVDDALIDDSSSNGTITLAEGEGATCVIYLTPISLRG